MPTFSYTFGSVQEPPQAEPKTQRAVITGERLSRVATFIADYWEANKFGPTLREIQSETCVSSLGTVRADIERLVEAGLVTYLPKQARTLVPTDKLLGRL